MTPALTWQLNTFALPQAIAAVLSFISAGIMWRHRRDSPGALMLLCLLLCAGWWALAGALEFCASTMATKIFLSQLSYFGVLGAPWALYRFVLSYTESDDSVPPWIEPVLVAAAVVGLGLVFTNAYHHWIWSSVTPITIHGFVFAEYEHGPVFWLVVLYCYGLMLTSCMLLLRYAVFTVGIYRFQSLIIVLATVCPWILSIAYLFKLGPYPELDQTPVGFAFGSLLMSWNILQWKLFDVSPVAAHTLFANMGDPILVLDPRGRIVHANPAAMRHFGLRPNQQGTELQAALAGHPAVLAALELAQSAPCQDRTGDGREIWWDIESTLLQDNRGVLRGRLFVFRDTTKLKQTAIELRRAKEAVEAADEAKTRFLASISHEIRTPLNAVAGYSQILQDRDDVPPGAIPALDAIREASDHLLDLIEAVLDLSKIESGKIDLVPEDFQIGDLLGSVHSIFAQTCQEKGVRLVVTTSPDLGAHVHGDDRKLRQILVNLVSNAVKFTDQGEIVLGVARQPGGRYRFQVSDTGAGMDEESQRGIFEEFHQTRAGRGKGGSGLGLAISRKLVTLLGGELTVVSVPGRGSTFSFVVSLPPARTRAQAAPQRRRLAPDCSVLALVVDDMKINRDVLTYLLRTMRCEVREAGSGEAALESYRAHGADIVFLDMNMQHPREGIEIAAALRARAFTTGRPLRIVCYSASAFEHQWQEFRASGFDDFLVKPVRLDRVRECLERLDGVKFSEG